MRYLGNIHGKHSDPLGKSVRIWSPFLFSFFFLVVTDFCHESVDRFAEHIVCSSSLFSVESALIYFLTSSAALSVVSNILLFTALPHKELIQSMHKKFWSLVLFTYALLLWCYLDSTAEDAQIWENHVRLIPVFHLYGLLQIGLLYWMHADDKATVERFCALKKNKKKNLNKDEYLKWEELSVKAFLLFTTISCVFGPFLVFCYVMLYGGITCST